MAITKQIRLVKEANNHNVYLIMNKILCNNDAIVVLKFEVMLPDTTIETFQRCYFDEQEWTNEYEVVDAIDSAKEGISEATEASLSTTEREEIEAIKKEVEEKYRVENVHVYPNMQWLNKLDKLNRKAQTFFDKKKRRSRKRESQTDNMPAVKRQRL